ncbi:MAG: histidine phosphatase family protein [Armatimonadota bacterium]|nr:histidine phosphatase family protein [Armatimonadota bacterium]
MLRILVVRHGQTAYNKELRNQGRADIELDEIGCAQAKSLASAISRESITAIYSSHLKRAAKTADALATSMGLEVIVDVRLAERDYGAWEGKTREEILESDKEGFALYRSDPVIQTSGGGETGLDVFMRVVSFLSELLQKHEDGTVVIVTHGGSGSALIAALLHGSPATADCIRLSNCSVSEVLIEGSRRRLARFDDHSHLTDRPLQYPHVGLTHK